MAGTDIRITAPDGVAYDCLLIGETAQARPALIVFSPIFGVDDDMERLAATWAGRGYIVAVPDYYHRVGGGVCDRSEAGRKAAVARWQALDSAMAVSDAGALVDYLRALPGCNGKIGTLGICAGGELAFLAAARLGLQAVVAYHGTHIDRHVDEAKGMTIPIALHYGDADNLVPMDKVATVKAGLAANPEAEVNVYAGAEHGFSFAGRPTYHETAATSADTSAQKVFKTLSVAA